jgi:hypothetical protein
VAGASRSGGLLAYNLGGVEHLSTGEFKKSTDLVEVLYSSGIFA